MRSIAIEREFGSGGREIGLLTAKLLGVPSYDGELLLDTAEHSGVDLALLRNFDERQAGSLLYDLALAANPNQYSERTRLYDKGFQRIFFYLKIGLSFQYDLSFISRKPVRISEFACLVQPNHRPVGQCETAFASLSRNQLVLNGDQRFALRSFPEAIPHCQNK